MKKLLKIILPLILTLAIFAVPAYASTTKKYNSAANKYSKRLQYIITVNPVRTGPNTARIDWTIASTWLDGGEGHGAPTKVNARISTTSRLVSNNQQASKAVTIKQSGSNKLTSYSGSFNVKVTEKQNSVQMAFQATGSGSYQEQVRESYTYYTTEKHYYKRGSTGVSEVSQGSYYSPTNGVGQHISYITYESVRHTGYKWVTYTRSTNSGTIGSTSFTVGGMEQYFYVTYDSVGGTAAPARQGFIGGQSVTISSSYPTYYYSDAGLNAKARGWSNTRYTPGTGSANYLGGTTYSTKADLTLYAVYPQRYSVTYNVGGGSPATPKQWFLADTSIKLTNSNLPKYWCPEIKAYGYTFKGWSTSSYPVGTGTPDGRYDPGDTYATNANLTLYAVYEPNQIGPIIYRANGGNEDSVPAAQNKYYNVDVYLRSGPIPTYPETANKGVRHFFKEWNTKPDGTGYSYKPGDLFTLNANPHEGLPQAQEQGGKGINLYAIWYDGTEWRTNEEDKLDNTAPKIRYIDKEHETYLTEDSKWKSGVRQTQLTESLDKDGQSQAKRAYDSQGNIITEH